MASFCFMQCLFNLMHNFFLSTGIYSDSQYRSIPETLMAIFKNVCFAGGSQLGGATWFLRTLFQVSLIYMVVIYVSHKFNIKKLIIVISIFVCVVCATVISVYKLKLPIGLHSFCAAFLAFLSGVFLHSTNFVAKVSKYKYRIIIICLLLLYLLSSKGKVNMSTGQITNVIFFLICSIAGWFLLYSIALCNGIKDNILLIYIGQHTLSILAFHFLAFKIVTFIYLWISNKNMLRLATFPVIKNVPFLWIPYTICGITIPLILGTLFARCKNIMQKHKGKLYRYETLK